MAYRIRFADRALDDLRQTHAAIDADNSHQAKTWFTGLRTACRSLDLFPFRAPRAPEADDLRHLLHGNTPNIYRIIFEVDSDQETVRILHIRHAARAPAEFPLA